MKELILYNDKTKIFEANIKVEGANLSDTKARLLLKFNNGFISLHEGILKNNGNCIIEIPPIKHADISGEAILEVIADSTIFEPWTSKFDVIQSKKVTIEVVENNTKPISKNTVSVDIKLNKKELIENKLKKLSTQEKLDILKTRNLTNKAKKWAIKEFKEYSKADILTAAILFNS